MGEDMDDEEVDKSGYDSMEEGGETLRSTSKLHSPASGENPN
jgi:hypothetical protein